LGLLYIIFCELLNILCGIAQEEKDLAGIQREDLHHLLKDANIHLSGVFPVVGYGSPGDSQSLANGFVIAKAEVSTANIHLPDKVFCMINGGILPEL
jgi:hypothetical protein